MGGHVPEYILGLDLEEETVGVGVEELAPIPVLRPELVVIEVVHQVLGEIQNAHPLGGCADTPTSTPSEQPRSGASGYELCASCKSSGYSRSTSSM